MAAADVSNTTPTPAPEECEHPGPVEGILAHEFAHYEGAQGPEGTRRTVTFYGPVVGGLPIAAWHCENCGLLRLRYPDGRREERRMFPGPQPGLLAAPSAIDPPSVFDGRQARVSGLSVSRDIAPVLRRGAAPAPVRSRRATGLVSLGMVDLISVIALVVTAVGLLAAAVLAVYTYSTSPYENEAVWTTLVAFAVVLVLQVANAAVKHFTHYHVHPVSPSAAETLRRSPRLDATTRVIVGLLVFTSLCGLGAAVLATYDYQTSTLELPVFAAGCAAFVLMLVIAVTRAAIDHFIPAEPGDSGEA